MQELKCRTHPVDGAKMVLVPAGVFTMGRPADDLFAKDHEKPQRTVFLSAYWIDVYPVTNLRFKRFVEDGGYERKDFWSAAGWVWRVENEVSAPLGWNRPGWDNPDQPVAGVSWFEAKAFCRWAGKRLPTEAQWEKAARGEDARDYPWGNDWPRSDLANFDNAVGRVTPVGAYPKGVSPYGCYDMAGNVNNWCQDWYWPGFYAWANEHDGNTDPVLGDALLAKAGVEASLKVDRGGGFATAREFQEVLRCTDKVAWEPQARELWNGFRSVEKA
jgi:formylglycine-generating enzyme required for sulfatase activity